MFRVHLVTKVLEVLQDHKVFPVQPVKREKAVFKDQRVIKDTQVSLDFQDQLEELEIMVWPVHPVQLVPE